MPNVCNIQIMFLEDQVECTMAAVDTVLAQLDGDSTVSVLLNGGRRPDLQAKFSGQWGVHYYESAANLGVAGGRNFLLNTRECRESEYVIFLDNDVLVPNDYKANVVKFFQSNPDAGVVGAISLKYAAIHGSLPRIGLAYTGMLGANIWNFSSKAMRDYFIEFGRSEIIDHIGTNEDWRGAYLYEINSLEAVLEAGTSARERSFHNFLAKDPIVVAAARNPKTEKISIGNVPGLCQSFRRSLVDELGQLNSLFNNYGFEDVDFCIRAKKAGYINYLNTRNFIVHGTDQRATRRSVYGHRNHSINQSRVRTLLDFLHEPESFPKLSLNRIFTRSLLLSKTRPESETEEAYYGIVGYQQALRQLSDHNKANVPPNNEATSLFGGSEAVKYFPLSWDTFRGGELDGELHIPRLLSNESRTDAIVSNIELHSKLTTERQTDLESRPRLKALAPGPQKREVDFSRLERFRDIHKGQRGFIIGNGPSLKNTDLTLLRGEVTFGVNGFFYMSDETGFCPTYYCVEDNHVVADNLSRINSYQVPAKFFPDKYRDVVEYGDSVYFLPTDWSFYFKSSPFFEVPQFSKEISKVVHVGQTVTYLNLQLAFFMGLQEVYLIGVDFHYDVPAEDPVEGFTIISQGDDPNHFHPEYFGRGKKWHFPKLHNCLKAYSHARTIYEGAGRKVYNATVGGRLEAYARRPYPELFEVSALSESANTAANYMLRSLLQDMSSRETTELRRAGRSDLLVTGIALDDATGSALAQIVNVGSKAGLKRRVNGELCLLPVDTSAVADNAKVEAPPNFKQSDLVIVDMRLMNLTVAQSISQNVAGALEPGSGFDVGKTLFVFADCGLSGRDVNTSAYVRKILLAAFSQGTALRVFNGIAVSADLVGADIGRWLTPAQLNATLNINRLAAADLLRKLAREEFIDRLFFVDLETHQSVATCCAEDWSEFTESLFARVMLKLNQMHIPFVVGAHGLYVHLIR